MKLLSPKWLLHLEGWLVLILTSLAYGHLGYSWWKFGALFLAPDLTMVGYCKGTRVGAALYNAAHTYLAIGILWLIGSALHWLPTAPLCLIWAAHIGFDRLLGYGLKDPTAFKDTHLGKV